MTCRKIEVTRQSQSNLICMESIFKSGKYIGEIISEKEEEGCDLRCEGGSEGGGKGEQC